MTKIAIFWVFSRIKPKLCIVVKKFKTVLKIDTRLLIKWIWDLGLRDRVHFAFFWNFVILEYRGLEFIPGLKGSVFGHLFQILFFGVIVFFDSKNVILKIPTGKIVGSKKWFLVYVYKRQITHAIYYR